MRKLPLHTQIIVALILGLIWGIVAPKLGLGPFTEDWILPFGTIFINLLKLIAIPLVLASLIAGITGLKDVSKLSKMGSRAITTYLITTVLAITIGLFAVNTIAPGEFLSADKRDELREEFSTQAEETRREAELLGEGGPLKPLVDIVPSNLFFSLSSNINMLQAVFFAVFFGLALVVVEERKKEVAPVRQFFEGLNEVILKMVDFIMYMAPLGVFALLAGLNADMELLQALAIYGLTVVLGLSTMIFIIYPTIMRIFSGVSYVDFFRGIFKAQMLAFSTSSSSATLPVTMDCAKNNLGVKEEVSSFVLPLGATINMDGTSLYQAVATVFIAQAFGTNLGLGEQLTIVLTAVLASIGSAGVPGAGMVMLSIVLQAVGLDPAGIALVIAVDRILDMLRTVVNVTGDATVCLVVNNTTSTESKEKA